MARRSERRQRGGGHPFRTLLVVVVLIAAAWFASLYVRIDRVAQEDQAAPSDAIAVFGAAQYVGRPSPVYHARLDHVVSLYEHGMAPYIVTLGGSSDKKNGLSEGDVGRNYLLANGVPYDHIIAETRSLDTGEQVDQLARIARDNQWKRVIVVSDGTHLFRIRALCEREGLNVLTSPRAAYGNLSAWGHFTRITHEMLSYTFLRLHVEAGWAKRWMEGKEEA
ncbi:YdcF family protein [Terriglobus sp. TAA 43]|uniref:YdcF family protein n=1 Tax=Terriglobus sp. TAA 43 TaxID=278961 RepID=UPI000647E3B6|nr:YdcF family protein [Terriglobus sp. TAA 43]